MTVSTLEDYSELIFMVQTCQWWCQITVSTLEDYPELIFMVQTCQWWCQSLQRPV